MNIGVGDSVVSLLVEAAFRLAGIAVLAAAVAAVTALAFRWYTRERVQSGVAVLLALATVAFHLTVKTAIGDVIAGETALFAPTAMAFNLGALALGALASPVGVRVGDRLATDFGTVAGVNELDARVSGLAKAVGRVEAVTIPGEIGDIVGYDPVSEAVKTDLAGKTLVFPRGSNLTDSLRNRLKEENGVGYVDAEFEAGELTYLALGARQSGLGPTLPPGTAATAVAADPPTDASPGDTVQVWTAGEEPDRVATAELRAVNGDTVTLALDSDDAEEVAGGNYRLLTLPREQRPERTFASLLRTADETMGTVKIEPGSPLVGIGVGAVDTTVAALRPASGSVVPIPPRGRVIEAGDTLYVVAQPGTIRALEEQATPTASSGQ